MVKGVKRLYESFKPDNYKIELSIDEKHKKFSGYVVIKGTKTGRPSKRITLHQKNLNITKVSLTKKDKGTDAGIKVERINSHKRYEELRIHSTNTLYPGHYTIEMAFTGDITDSMNGLYPSYFKDSKESQKILFATQFESHYAREVFPCIDEPEAKATFDLSLTTSDNKETVLSNTPIKSQTIKNRKKYTTFETTPKMSTYLLAFAVGEVEYKEAETNSGIKVRTYATADKVEFTEFALQTAVRCLEFYEDFFDIPYPLNKCDMLALPDFSSGAMENWGLVTYREQAMLVDPKNTSIGAKQYVAMVVAHELAHQWFGNLVTMSWWTDLWLNEGFASWIEYLAVDEQYPEWRMWEQFIADEQQTALKLDALKNTHPVEVQIKHPDEIRSIFDTISYNKGASMIHMLYSYLGEKDFRNGLRFYLKKNAYGNTCTNDLWTALETVSKKPVSSFMSKWTSLSGFPLLSCHFDSKSSLLTIKQSKFTLVDDENKKQGDLWPIPLLSRNSHIPEQIDVKQVEIANYSIEDVLVVNNERQGFYRVLYDDDLLENILLSLNNQHPLTRLGILADIHESTKRINGNSKNLISTIKQYSHEDNMVVWGAMTSAIKDLRRIMDNDAVRKGIDSMVLDLIDEQFRRLGVNAKDDDTHFDKLLRPIILGLGSSANHKTIIKWCHSTFNKISNLEEIHADTRSVVLATVAREGNESTFNKLMELHDSTINPEDKVKLAAALTSFKQEPIVTRALDQISSSKVRRQDAMYWLAYSLANRHAKDLSWQWIQDNWDWLSEALGDDLSFYRIPMYVARSFSHKSFMTEFIDFFEEKKQPVLDRSIKQGIETLEWQIRWRARDINSLKEYFTK